MFRKDGVVVTDKFANGWVIFSSSLFVFLLILWFTTKNSFLTGIGAFSISSILVITYSLYSSFNNRKNKKEEV